jgi:hypothetical protein
VTAVGGVGDGETGSISPATGSLNKLSVLSKQRQKYCSMGVALAPLTGDQPSRCMGEFEARVFGFDIRANIRI